MSPAVGIGHPAGVHQRAGRHDLSATISALEQSGESQTLSAPRLTVLNNRPATISDGQVQYYYEEYAACRHRRGNITPPRRSSPAANRPRSPPGAELNVLASISGDGKSILLALNPKVNTQVIRWSPTPRISQFNAAGDPSDDLSPSTSRPTARRN